MSALRKKYILRKHYILKANNDWVEQSKEKKKNKALQSWNLNNCETVKILVFLFSPSSLRLSLDNTETLCSMFTLETSENWIAKLSYCQFRSWNSFLCHFIYLLLSHKRYTVRGTLEYLFTKFSSFS